MKPSRHLTDWFAAQSRPAIAARATAMIVLIGCVDYLSGNEISW